MQKVKLVLSILLVGVLCGVKAREESILKSGNKHPEVVHYCIPVSGRVARVINSVSNELKISLREFFALRGMNLHSEGTTKLIKDSEDRWRLEFVAVPDVALAILLTQSTLETTKDQDNKLLSEPKLIKRLVEGIRESDPAGDNLNRMRRFEEEIKKASLRVWPLNGESGDE
jgi:hypothetical protein